MSDKIFTASEALAHARTLYKNRYAGAEFCLAAGSIITGSATQFSDLDLVIVSEKIDAAYRESFIFDGMPVEAFVHDYETIQSFMDGGYDEGEASLLDMIVTGIALPEENVNVRKLKSYAQHKLDAGPPPLTKTEAQQIRYFITDLLDDLRGERPAAEHRATLYKLYPKIGTFLLRMNGSFIAEGKRLPRCLKDKCPIAFLTLEAVMQAAHDGSFSAEHIRRLEELMTPYGGAYFDGFKQQAPVDKRKQPEWFQG